MEEDCRDCFVAFTSIAEAGGAHAATFIKFHGAMCGAPAEERLRLQSRPCVQLASPAKSELSFMPLHCYHPKLSWVHTKVDSLFAAWLVAHLKRTLE